MIETKRPKLANDRHAMDDAFGVGFCLSFWSGVD